MYTNGRTLLNEMVAEGTYRGLRVGATLKHAAEAEGIGARTAMRWMEYGRAFERALNEGREPNVEHEASYESMCNVEQARNKARVAASGTTLRAALGEIRRDENGDVLEVVREPDWKAALAWLERQDPEEWGRRNRPVEADATDADDSIDESVRAAERLVSEAAQRIAAEAAGE